ncbi:MAG TPA: carboxypeptidase-like regulatory domain-containing protein [Terriglobia bacterium]|nr:carboxypeptidase-like regulatory domain-containing protein [Terriglobia bacterium]
MTFHRLARTAFVLFAVSVLCVPFANTKEKKPKDSFKVSGYVGTSSTSAAPGVNVVLIEKETRKSVDSVSTNFLGRYKFSDVKPGTYIVKCDKVEREVTVISKDIRMDIDLSAAGGVMDYVKGAATQAAASSSSAAPAPPGPSDPALQKVMAGEYYSFTGNTERKLMLCANGTFYDSRESSYSGSLGTDQANWGAASAGQGSGSYSIQGSEESGTIQFSYKGGKRATSRYQSTGERGCYSFDGQTFCYSGGARCP